MININANDAREEIIKGFIIVCEQCGSNDIKITIGGAEEHGEVGTIEMICRECKQLEYAQKRLTMWKFKQGEVLKDKATGFIGVVEGRSDYFTNCLRYLLRSQSLKDGKRLKSDWFDEGRLMKAKDEKK